jgi:hypothetical protein
VNVYNHIFFLYFKGLLCKYSYDIYYFCYTYNFFLIIYLFINLVDQLKKKLVELSNIFKARQAVLDQERREKQKLLDTIAHYKRYKYIDVL